MAQLNSLVVTGDAKVLNNLDVDTLKIGKYSTQIVTGTYTAGSNVDTTYYPAKQTFDLGLVPTEGNEITIKTPDAGYSKGVWLSADNGTTYRPIAIQSGTRLNTEFPASSIITLVYCPSIACSTYDVDGATASASVTGVQVIKNFYNTNTNTYVTQTATTTNANYEVLFSATADNTTRTEGARKASNLKFNPSTGNLTITQLNGYTPNRIGADAYCSTPAATAAKVASAPGFVLRPYARFILRIVNSNTAKSALTLEVNGTGALPISINGAASSSTNYTLPAGDYFVYLNSTTSGYLIRTDNVIQGAITGNAANVTGTVAVANGGTGATTAADARTNLGAASSTHTHGAATTAADGFMTTAQVTKLDKFGDGYVTVGRKSGSTAGSRSTAEGSLVVSSGSFAHAEADATSAIGHYSHAEGSMTCAYGSKSHVEGQKTCASHDSAHAEGQSTLANNNASHAEGYNTKAFGSQSHAEGEGSSAGGATSHVEGYYTSTSGQGSHTEGQRTYAVGIYSHAEGNYTTAAAEYCHTSGARTSASNMSSFAIGHQNAAMTTGGGTSNTTGTAFVIGNGTSISALKNAFSVQFDGTVKAASTITASTTADYAEYFEQYDGNQNNEDRVGYFVTFLNGNKIAIAEPNNDYILGIVSGEPFVLGNGDCDVQNGMVMRDEYRRVIYEPAPKMETNEETGEEEPIYDEQGNPVYEGTRPVYNPDYDPSIPYINRADRPEWSPIGMLGVLCVRDNGECQVNQYCTVGEGGIAVPATLSDVNKWRVIKRNSNNVIEIVFR